VWCWTYTVCPEPSDGTGQNTKFVAISEKGEDHQVMEKIFGAEMILLSTEGAYFYHGGLKRIIKVKLGRLGTVVDRPERVCMFCIGDHGGSFSVFWGYALSVDGYCKVNNLPSCESCRRRHLRLQLECQIAANQTADESSLMDISMNAPTIPAIPATTTVMTLATPPENGPVCQQNKCSSWTVLDPAFTFNAPTDYPVVCDTRLNAPVAPAGRAITGLKGAAMQLRAVYLTPEWLKQAVVFAHHNMREKPPDSSHSRKRFWTKACGVAYLRSCGMNAKLQNAIYASAMAKEQDPPFPPTWFHPLSLLRTHFAPMHTLHLGQTKSNIDLNGKWLATHELKATFGKQSNMYLEDIRKLGCSRFFDSHIYSRTAWGTGTWVSENYSFFARTQKFWFLLPAIQESKFMKDPNNVGFKKEVQIVLRFNIAAMAAMGRVMSTNRVVEDMDRVMKLYLDAMVEMDRMLLKLPTPGEDEEEAQEEGVSAAQEEGVSTSRGKKKNPTFTKSISLGTMAFSKYHEYAGPSRLYYEGDFSGEKKSRQLRVCFQ